jgi:Txe/YoeB family toxin of toxin-antitoxin system
MPNRTGKQWSGHTINRILDNPVYVGDLAYRDVDAHEPLIGRDTSAVPRTSPTHTGQRQAPHGEHRPVARRADDRTRRGTRRVKLSWTDHSWDDYVYWQTQDRKTLKRINALIADIKRDPDGSGIGKPELLRNNLAGLRSGARAARTSTASSR